MRFFLTALAWVLFCAPAMAQDQCKLTPVASLPLTLRDNQASVPVTIGGRKLQLLVDTGATGSMLREPTVTSLGLEQRLVEAGDFRIYGDFRISHYVEAQDVALGRLVTPKYQFLVLPAQIAAGLDGILAPDILLAFDADFDFAGGKLNLISQDHCEGRVTYWTSGEVARIPFHMDQTGHIRFTFTLDGKDFTAILDTGATQSAVSLEFAEAAFGFSATSPDLHPSALVNGKAPSYRYPFKTLALGGLTVRNPAVSLVSDWDSGMRGTSFPRAILGMDVLTRLHLYVAYREKMLYITPATAQ